MEGKRKKKKDHDMRVEEGKKRVWKKTRYHDFSREKQKQKNIPYTPVNKDEMKMKTEAIEEWCEKQNVNAMYGKPPGADK